MTSSLPQETLHAKEPSALLSKELHLSSQILDIIGSEAASSYFGYLNAEVLSTRRAFMTERLAYFADRTVAEQSADIFSVLPSYTGCEPMPLSQEKSFILQCNLPASSSAAVCSIAFSGEEPIDDLKATVFRKLSRLEPVLRNDTPDDYVFKLTGFHDYLYGPHRVMDFDCVRKCVSKRESVVLSLVPKEELRKLFPIDISAYEKTLADIVLEEMPDFWPAGDVIDAKTLHDPLEVTIESIVYLPPSLVPQAGCHILYLMAEVYHGGVPISQKEFTESVVASSNPQWYATLVFRTIQGTQGRKWRKRDDQVRDPLIFSLALKMKLSNMK